MGDTSSNLRSFTKRNISVEFNEKAVFSLKDSTGKWKDMVEFKLRVWPGINSKQVSFDILDMLGHDDSKLKLRPPKI